MSDFTWSIANRACKATWTVLRTLKQFPDTFATAGAVPMKAMEFWNPLESDDLRRASAEGLASELHEVLSQWAVGFEAGYNRTTAVETMTDQLVKETATLCDLASAVDDAYHFADEKS